MTLPPKRWESTEDPKYDSIRHHPWFRLLERRKKVIPMMIGAYKEWDERDSALTLNEVCDKWGISPREFRDYRAFQIGSDRFGALEDKRTYQKILDLSYDAYVYFSCEKTLYYFIQHEAPKFGINPRRVRELWETDKNFWPTNHPK